MCRFESIVWMCVNFSKLFLFSGSQFTGIGLKFFNIIAQNHTYTTHDPFAPGMDSNISIMPCFDKQAKGH